MIDRRTIPPYKYLAMTRDQLKDEFIDSQGRVWRVVRRFGSGYRLTTVLDSQDGDGATMKLTWDDERWTDLKAREGSGE